MICRNAFSAVVDVIFRLARPAVVHAQSPSRAVIDEKVVSTLFTPRKSSLNVSAFHCYYIIMMSIRYRAILCRTCSPPNSMVSSEQPLRLKSDHSLLRNLLL